ncbi:MAG: ADP-ribosylglycohydrolase family protein [Gaiellales bacterium]
MSYQPLHDPLDPRDQLFWELAQARESGREVGHLEAAIATALVSGPLAELLDLYRRVERAPRVKSWPYEEPSSYDEILAACPPGVVTDEPHALDGATLADRLLAAWRGRCAGCVLGKPVEGWSREEIRRLLDSRDAYPLADWFPEPRDDSEAHAYRGCWVETVQGRIASVSRDDDIDYSILALHLLEEVGFEFGPRDVAREWLDHFPYTQIYTAERAAYRNLLRGVAPPGTADTENPYREWIGAQIRADVFGWVSPGRPADAARLAFQDASLSHTANGIYGEMWAAALIAASFTAPDLEAAVRRSMAFVPTRSRLHEALAEVIGAYEEGVDWEEARDRIERRTGHYEFVHTINNAAVVAASLLWGGDDFTRVIGLAVQGGWDTDCNGATAGSAFGARYGTAAIPERWYEPFDDIVRSALFGFDHSRISDFAVRTLALARATGRGGS